MMSRVIPRLSPMWLPPWPLTMRQLSSELKTDQVQFTYALGNTSRDAISSMMDDIASKPLSANSTGHNSAVVLGTPEFTKHFEDIHFMGSMATLLAGQNRPGQFFLLCGIVDGIAPPLGRSYHHASSPGISVLRGHVDHMIPGLWRDPKLLQPPSSPEDKDAVSALTLSLGASRVTLPLARTTFQNSRASTFLSAGFDLSEYGTQIGWPQEERYMEEVVVSDDGGGEPPRRIGDLGLWAPLVPVTPPRLVAASFGNIVRGVEVDGHAIPASTELEDAVNAFLGKRGSSAPVGIWALVTPQSDAADAAASWLNGSPTPLSVDTSESSMQDLITKTAEYLHSSHRRGAKLLQVLSGGGGWGAKKGLLSLDPQRTHFALSEEEEMRRFAESMNGSTFAPAGCTIQFLMALDDVPPMPEYGPPSIVLGVPGTPRPETSSPAAAARPECPEKPFTGGHFGALSSHGIFVAGPGGSGPGEGEGEGAEQLPDERKLSVPNSRLFVAESIDEQMKGIGKMPTVAEAGLMALLL